MGAMEVPGDKKGQEGGSGSTSGGMGGNMPRATSVDDLFAPMCRLDVQSLGASVSASAAAASADEEGQIASWSDSFQSNRNSLSRIADKTPASSSTSGADKGADVSQPDLSVASRDLHHEHGHDRGGDTNFSPGKFNPEGQSNFTSDDDQLVIDERKQKRMISNRESARRSRLRKQQHLDELRSQVAHLRAENTHMLNRFSLASQQYAQLTDENCVLRSNAIDLRHQLQMLHHASSGHQPVPLQPRSIGSVHSHPLNLSLCSGQNEDPNWG